MITSNILNFSSMSTVKAKVDIYNGDTLAATCTCGDFLEQFKIAREGDTSKFFGFGVCHKLSINLIDLFRNLPSITTANTLEVSLGDGTIFDTPFPTFYISEVNRDEKTNTITATAYDALMIAATHTYDELGINTPYTFKTLSEAISAFLGLSLILVNDNGSFDLTINDVSLEGTENLRQILDSIAECTQTIYFINHENKLVFKRLDKDGEAVHSITKNSYFELDTKTNKTLGAICSATELGDNIATTGGEGITQYVRDNPFWVLYPNLFDVLDAAIDAIGGFTIGQFRCDWEGDYRLEIGDKIALVAQDNTNIYSYLLRDNIGYDGTLNEITEWEFTENNTETASNPTNIGEKLNQTSAKVDKVNKTINLLVADSNEFSDRITVLELNTEGISASVTDIGNQVAESYEGLANNLEALTKEVNLKMTSEQVDIAISSSLENGVDKVTTTTGYTFDEAGLNISKSGSEITTNISEDGMKIKRGYDEVLVADNTGVKAEDLHATTYLIIGGNSRIENIDSTRTACFWIGE